MKKRLKKKKAKAALYDVFSSLEATDCILITPKYAFRLHYPTYTYVPRAEPLTELEIRAYIKSYKVLRKEGTYGRRNKAKM